VACPATASDLPDLKGPMFLHLAHWRHYQKQNLKWFYSLHSFFWP
jgi:hypothetical protein